MTAQLIHDPASGVAEEPRGWSWSRVPRPPRAVVLSFCVSRLVVVAVALVVGFTRSGESWLSPLLHWDYVWYSEVSAHGFAVVRDQGQTGWPFFPLLPLFLWFGRALGLPSGLVGIVVVDAAFFAALWGVHVLARRHYSERSADLAAWGLSLFPSSVAFTMVYSDALALAATTWAFVSAEHRRDAKAGVLGAVATLARPNGVIGAVALAGAVDGPSRARRVVRVLLPSLGVFAAWLGVQWWATGDPLRFLHAKLAWDEVTVVEAVADVRAHVQWPELVLVAVGAAAVLWCWRQRGLPRGWLVLYLLSLVPSLVTGMTGIARYSVACFVPAVCCGVALERMPRALRVTCLSVLLAALVVVSALVFTENWTP
ncbi:MAG: hypothetical protein K1X95_12240 [Acidimicrobiia bacterium]|nr:hypothetical protein [Acidimicrobiia bacterium]